MVAEAGCLFSDRDSMLPAVPSQAPDKISVPWKTRLRAWWEGRDLKALPDHLPGESEPEGEEIAPDSVLASRFDLWSATRIEIVEMVWGAGFHLPGGDENIPVMIKPLGLNESMSVLELGAGLGGITRHMAKATGAWISGLESDRLLTVEGMQRSKGAGMERRAPIHHYDPEQPAFTKRFDAIVAKEHFFTVKDKDGLLDAVRTAMKPRGQILFTDYVVANDERPDPGLAGWVDKEPVRPVPWSVTRYKQTLAKLSFDVRICEDVSDQTRTLIQQSWADMKDKIPKEKRADPETQEVLIREAELWMRRVAALQAGALRVYRFHALFMGE